MTLPFSLVDLEIIQCNGYSTKLVVNFIPPLVLPSAHLCNFFLLSSDNLIGKLLYFTMLRSFLCQLCHFDSSLMMSDHFG